MRGFTLVELLVGLLMTVAMAAATLGLLQSMSRTALAQRKVLTCERQLDLGWALLQHLLEGVEHEWWQALPMRTNFGESADAQHGAVQFRRHCQHESNTPCLTIWDIVPRTIQTPIIKLSGGDLPLRLDVSISSSQGSAAQALTAAEAGDVLLVQGPQSRFCALIDHVQDGLIFLAPEHDQPWQLPRELSPDEPLEALLIGPLELTHLFLQGDHTSPQRRRLFYRKTTYSRYGWRDDRAQTASTQLVDLQFTALAQQGLAQIHLYAQPQIPKALPQAIQIGPRRFQQEVFHASYTF